MRDLMNNIDLKRGISPIAAVNNANTAYVSQILDTRGLKSATFALIMGSITDANATFTVLAEESEDSALAGQTAIADANLLGTEALAAPVFGSDDKVFKLGFIDTMRYIRVTLTPAGNDAGDIFAAGLWITEPETVPTANPPA